MHKTQHGAGINSSGEAFPPLKTIIVPKIQSIIFVGMTTLQNIKLHKCHGKTFTELLASVYEEVLLQVSTA